MATSNRFLDVTLLLSRIALGLYLLLAGWGKLMGDFSNGLGSFYRSDAYQGLEPNWLIPALSAPYGYALPWAEVVFGALLIIGLISRISAGAVFLMIVSFLIAQLYADFSKYFAPGPGPFNTNFVLAALALLLVATGPGRFAVDRAIGRKPRRKSAEEPKKKPGPRL